MKDRETFDYDLLYAGNGPAGEWEAVQSVKYG